MSPFYSAIYLAPHLDDVALSCGGQIADATAVANHLPILIVTITAGDPPPQLSSFAAQMHQRWELVSETVAQRRAEDRAACAILGAEYAHWSVPDCIYRTDPSNGQNLYASESEIFGVWQRAEAGLLAQLAAQIAALPPHDRLVVPLAVGNHVDHQLTRLAAEGSGLPLAYYEDYPYVQKPGALTAVIPDNDPHWQAETIAVTAEGQQKRIEAIAAYASQIEVLFKGQERMSNRVREYMAQVHGERVWHKK